MRVKRLPALLLTVFFILALAGSALAQPAQITVEGQGDYFVTGESYPTSIQMAGYNSRDDKLYMTFELETTKAVDVAEVATFGYFIEVFDGDGEEIGNAGTYAAPETVAGAAGAQTASVTNEEIDIAPALTAAFRAVITVKEVTIA